jgi:hypothetical protein
MGFAMALPSRFRSDFLALEVAARKLVEMRVFEE